MKYVYICLLAVSCLLGCYIGSKLSTRTVVREVPVTVTKTQTVTKEVIKQADGTVIERVVTQTKDQTKTSPQPKAQYRVGVLLPLKNELEFESVTVTAGRRLVNQLWLESEYDIKRKELKVGFVYEF